MIVMVKTGYNLNSIYLFFNNFTQLRIFSVIVMYYIEIFITLLSLGNDPLISSLIRHQFDHIFERLTAQSKLFYSLPFTLNDIIKRLLENPII